MQADLPMAAFRGFHKPAHGVITLPGTLPLPRILQLLDEMRQQSGIALLPQQHAIRL